MIRNVLKMGDLRLLEVSRPVLEFGTPELLALVEDLFDTMKHLNGVGLAAPQIGVRLRVVVFGVSSSPRYPNAGAIPPTILINPELTPIGLLEQEDWEGCLSVPGFRGIVSRWNQLRYSGFDVEGQRLTHEVAGFHARVVQHECDHLDGVLYPMRLRDMTRFGYSDVLFPDNPSEVD